MKSLQEITEITKQALKQLQLAGEPKNLYDPIVYSLSAGGKRIRPMALLLAANMYNNDISGAIPAALAVEIFHNFTLLHDDIMDNAPMRRGVPTVHKKWDSNCAILSGDAMMILAYKEISLCPAPITPHILRIFNDVAIGVCEGQQLDMDFEARGQVSTEEYINMIELKTALLLGGALQMGALCGGADSTQAEKLYDFGINLGIAFQLQDDLLDTYADSTIFGKEIGGDIICGKKTFLLTTALTIATPELKNELLLLIGNKSMEPTEKIRKVTGIYNSLGIKELTQTAITRYFNEGLTVLDSLSVEPARLEQMKALALMLLDRQK